MSQTYYGNYSPYGVGGYQSPMGFGGQAPASGYATVQPTTNKIYVTSLEDAMQRYASPNSTMVYVIQDESAMVEIYTDIQGKKIPKVKKLVDFAPEGEGGGFVSRAEFDELKRKFEAFSGTKGEEV